MPINRPDKTVECPDCGGEAEYDYESADHFEYKCECGNRVDVLKDEDPPWVDPGEDLAFGDRWE